MGVWDQFRKAKKAGERFLAKIDQVERDAREADPHKEARRLAFMSSETELKGGVEDLEGFGAEQSADVEGASLEDGDLELIEEEGSNPFFAEIEAGPLHTEDLEFEEVHLEDYTASGEATATQLGDDLGEYTEVGERTGDWVNEATATSDLTPHEGLDTLEYASGSTGELTAVGEKTQALAGVLSNSLGFDEGQIATILRFEHYPGLSEEPLRLLVELARFEGELMALGQALGAAAFCLLEEVVPNDEDWEAAVWTTGAHWDHSVKQGILGYGKEGSPLNARALGWAFWPFTDELLSAAVGLEDRVEIGDIVAKIDRVLDQRWARVESRGEALEAEGDHLPVRARGIFSFEGFQWEA